VLNTNLARVRRSSDRPPVRIRPA